MSDPVQPFMPFPMPPEADAAAVAVPRWQRVLFHTGEAVLLLLLSWGLYLGCVALYTRHNDSPLAWHPDEPGKIGQLFTNTRNYNHPQLMLEAARLWVPPAWRPGQPPAQKFDPQAAVEMARGVSGRFAAATAVLLAWAGFAAVGWYGFVALAVTIALCPALLSHAHVFKEDASLMFGIAATLCAGAWVMRVRRRTSRIWMTAALGVGCGLAASGKYCGAIMLGPAILLSVVVPLWRRQWGLAVFGPLLVTLIAAQTWADVNYRALGDWDRFVASFTVEKEHSITEHGDLTMDRPNDYFVDAVWSEAMPHAKVLAIAGVPLLLWQIVRLGRWGFGAWLALTAGVYLLMLSYSVLPFYRYALPVTVMLYAFAALAVAWAALLFRKPWQRAAALAAGLLVVGGLQGYRCVDYTDQIANDSRAALHAWVNANLPPGTAVVVDGYTQLSNGRGFGWDYSPANTKVRLARVLHTASYTEPLDRLRREGVKYAIVAGSAADRYTDPHSKASPGKEDNFAARREFYLALRAFPVVWSRIAAHPMRTFNNPDITVYRIDGSS